MSNESTKHTSRGQGRRATTSVAVAMIGVTLVSVLVIAVFDYYAIRGLLDTASERQLDDVAASRGERLEGGFEALGRLMVTAADDEGTVDAMLGLGGEYRALDRSLEATQAEELLAAYEEEIASLVPTGITPPAAEELLPVSDTAQYLQYWYIAENPFEMRSDLLDAGDGSPYSAAHALHHPALREMADVLDVGDLLLVDGQTGSVVYSVDKRLDFGTSLVEGPFKDSSLAAVVIDHVRNAAADEAVYVDFEPYGPAGGEPLLFVAAGIRDEGRIIGALVAEVPNEVVTSVATADQDWEGTGLGETGEVYIVGADAMLRSDSRQWLEDPDAYLETIREAGYGQDVEDSVVALDTTVLTQPADTEAVESALAGDEFIDTTTNYLGQKTITVARPLDVATMQWVVVADVGIGEAQTALSRYTRTLGLLALLLVPAVTIFAWFASRTLLKPIAPISEASERVTAGDLDVTLPSFGRDEYGDVATKFNALIHTLREQEGELRAAEEETTELLMAVMPSQLADQFLHGDRDIAEAVGDATLIALTIAGPRTVDPTEEEALADLVVETSAGVSRLAETHGVQLLSSSASQLLYAAGLTSEGDDSEVAVKFAMAVRQWVGETARSGDIALEFRGGVAAGDVVVGVVGTDRASFSVWGAPRRRAAELAAVAHTGQVLVGPSVAGKIGDSWVVEAVPERVDLEGETLDGWRVIGPR